MIKDFATGAHVSPPAGPAPIKGVIFDFHGTLVGAGQPHHWLEAAWAYLGHVPGACDAAASDDVCEHLRRIWEHAHSIDPNSERDLSEARHRQVFAQTVGLLPNVAPDLVDALYCVMVDQMIAFADTRPVLRSLQRQGIRTVVMSNIGTDVRGCLEREGLADLLDGVLLSYEVGAVKPQPEIFVRALDVLDLPAANVLMVGDNWRDDVGGAALGIRTLILPATTGPVHGLQAVLRLVGDGGPS